MFRRMQTLSFEENVQLFRWITFKTVNVLRGTVQEKSRINNTVLNSKVKSIIISIFLNYSSIMTLVCLSIETCQNY